MVYDFLIVGAGLAGATVAERLASQLGASVLVVERRGHVAGLCHDCLNDEGIMVHRYGPHIFHTKSRQVWEYLSQFTEWHLYEHRVKAYVDGTLVPVPVNLDTVNAIQGVSLAEDEMPAFMERIGEHVGTPRTAADVAVSRVGRLIYEKLFRNYTIKQWGISPEELSPVVTARIPVRMNRDDRYFDDRYQGLPRDGYTRMVERMLDCPGIDVRLGTDFNSQAPRASHGVLVYTGPLDRYFDFSRGRLPYRTSVLRHETHDVEWFQPAGVVNYPNDHEYTRVTEFKHMTGQEHPRTAIAKEYPRDAGGEGEPFWPVLSAETEPMAESYRAMARDTPNTLFVGRLAEYRYYNMDAVVARSLEVFAGLKERGI